MLPSYRKINYALRPAKTAQRKMIVEACGRLRSFLAIDSFRYIGLGSPFFNDFSALHREYGITNMVCIEQEQTDQRRFDFNRPFSCIEMQWGTSNDILPSLTWTGIPSIIWMDYDGTIGPNILSDLSTIFTNIDPFGMVLITVQSKGSSSGAAAHSLMKLRRILGSSVPANVQDSDMVGKKYQALIRRIIDNEISKVLSQRNATVQTPDVMNYKQLFNFYYRDSVPMTTIGGIVYPQWQANVAQSCEFEQVSFVRTQQSAFEIDLPILTHREQRRLDSLLPSGNFQEMVGILPEDLVHKYRRIYRYYPTFAESDL